MAKSIRRIFTMILAICICTCMIAPQALAAEITTETTTEGGITTTVTTTTDTVVDGDTSTTTETVIVSPGLTSCSNSRHAGRSKFFPLASSLYIFLSI